jgi:hypothetical protein
MTKKTPDGEDSPTPPGDNSESKMRALIEQYLSTQDYQQQDLPPPSQRVQIHLEDHQIQILGESEVQVNVFNVLPQDPVKSKLLPSLRLVVGCSCVISITLLLMKFGLLTSKEVRELALAAIKYLIG